METSEIILTGKIVGFEDYNSYILHNPFDPSSPLRVMTCPEGHISFVVVNPFQIVDEYAFEIDDETEIELNLEKNGIEHIAVFCIVKIGKETLQANLRSPIIINTKDGRFLQIILQDERYGTSVPFTVKKMEEGA